MPMIYMFKDPELAEDFRKLGFSVIKGMDENNFGVVQCQKLDELIKTSYADFQFVKSPMLCF